MIFLPRTTPCNLMTLISLSTSETGDIVPFSVQLMPGLARAISTPAAIEDLFDGGHGQSILPDRVRCQGGISLHCLKAEEYR